MFKSIKRSPHYRWYVFASVSLGTFMSTLDGSIVNVALPTIAKDFNVDLHTLQWIPGSYLLIITSLLLFFGRLADIVGKRKVFSWGYIGFIIGSFLCGLSHSVTFLIFARVIQGIGASMMMANSPGIITKVFPPQERGRALGTVGTVVALGSMTGPPLGGLITGIIGWQWIFFINIPLGLIGLWGSSNLIPEEQGIKIKKFDYQGTFTWAIGIILLLIGFTQVETKGWTFSVLSLIFIGLFSIILFVKIESKIKEPLLDLTLFKNPIFTTGNIAGFLSFVTLFFLNLFMPFYFQEIKGFSPQKIGFIMMSYPIAMSLVAPVSGYLSDKYGFRIFTCLGMGLLTLNFLVLSRITANSPTYLLILSQCMAGIGMGIFQSPNNSSVMGVVPPNKLGIAGGVLATMRNLGMVLGIALSVSIFSFRLNYVGDFALALGETYLVAAFVALGGLIFSLIRGKEYKIT